MDITKWSILKSHWLHSCSQRWRSHIQSSTTRLGADCGSDYALLIPNFKLKLKTVGKTTRLARYELNRILYKYAVEVTNRFKGLDLINSVHEEIWTEVHKYCTGSIEQNHPREKEKQEGKMVFWGSCTNGWRKKRSEKQGRKGKVYPNAEFQRTAQRDKKTFFNEQRIKLEENNRREKTRDPFRKIGNIKGTFHQRWAQ